MSSVVLPRRRSYVLSLLLLRGNPQGKSWWYTALRLAVAGLYLYAAVILGLLAAEDRILYHPVPAARHWNPPPRGLEPRDVEFTSADGTRLHGWWCVPAGWTPEQGSLLLCHGNSGNISYLTPAALHWQEQLHVAVFLFDYPGFGRSEGSPSEAGCYAAGDAAYDWIINEQKIPPNRLLLHGQSLGSGVAVNLAVHRPHRALILTSPFTSFPAVAQAILPLAPAYWLVHNQFHNDDKIAQVTTPVFIAHGTADHVIPYYQGERLFALATSKHKRFLRVEDGPHNLIHSGAVQRAVRDFLDDVDATDRPFARGERIAN